MKENEIEEELISIRSLMERSSKFISLSGLSGVLAGVYALIGAAFAYYVLYKDVRRDTNNPRYYSIGELMDSTIGYLIIAAVLILITSVVTAYIFATSKAKRKSQPVLSNTSRSLLFHMSVPLVTGGVLTLIFITHEYFSIAVPSMLVFYGLSLVSASNFTYTDVKYLGLCEIILGLIAACLPGYGLLFWALGFGVLHIIYGTMMYFKYDR